MPQSFRSDQHGHLLSDTEFIQRVAEAVAATLIAHYECGFVKVGVTPEGCIVRLLKTYFETPTPDRLSAEEFKRLSSVLASLLDSIDAHQIDVQTLDRIKRENNLEHKKQAIEKAKGGK